MNLLFPSPNFTPETQFENPINTDITHISKYILDKVNKNIINGEISNKSTWFYISQMGHKGLLNCIEKNDPEALNDFLLNLHNRGALLGMDQHAHATEKLINDEKKRESDGKMIYRMLLAFASSRAICRLYNPEQKGNEPYLEKNLASEYLKPSMLSLNLKKNLPCTSYNKFGLVTNVGTLSSRDIINLGYAKEVINQCNSNNYSGICEIGGGFGKLAYFLDGVFQLPYTIIDLPVVNILQYFLLKSNGINVTLWEDRQISNNINLLNAFSKNHEYPLKNHLFVNADSFVEMSEDTQNTYFELIAKNKGHLLSINHEADKIMTPTGDRQQYKINRIENYGYKKVSRHLFWERSGYAVELYVPIDTPNGKT